MNRLLLEECDRVSGDLFRFGGARARHTVEVIGAEPGRVLQVGLLDGPLGTGRVVSAGAGGVEIEVVFEAAAPPRPKLDVILAIPRPKVLRRVLADLASFGVDRIVLLRSWRVERSYLDADVLEAEVQRPILLDGLMQGGLTHAPVVSVERLFRPFIEDRAPGLFPPGGGVWIVAHPDAEDSIARLAIGAEDRAVVAIGPEGGWVDFELASFRSAGFIQARITRRILKVEAACAAVLGQIDLLREMATPPT